LKDYWSDDKKLEVIEKVYKELSDPKHPVSIAMARQKTMPGSADYRRAGTANKRKWWRRSACSTTV